jgi:hypothetical protein
VSPELIDADFAIAAANHGHPGFVDVDAVVTMDCPQLQIVETSQPPGRTLQPARQRRSINLQAMPCQHLGLAINRKVPGKALRHDPGDQRGCRHSAFDHPARRRCLDDAALAGPASILGTDGRNHAQDGRHDVEGLAHVLTDLVHAAFTADALGAVRFDDVNDPGQMLGQSADVAPGTRLCPLGIRSSLAAGAT